MHLGVRICRGYISLKRLKKKKKKRSGATAKFAVKEMNVSVSSLSASLMTTSVCGKCAAVWGINGTHIHNAIPVYDRECEVGNTQVQLQECGCR